MQDAKYLEINGIAYNVGYSSNDYSDSEKSKVEDLANYKSISQNKIELLENLIGGTSVKFYQGGIDTEGNEDSSDYWVRSVMLSNFELLVNSGYNIAYIAIYNLDGSFRNRLSVGANPLIAEDPNSFYKVVIFKGNQPDKNIIRPSENIVSDFKSGIYKTFDTIIEGDVDNEKSARHAAQQVATSLISKLPNEEDLTIELDGQTLVMKFANRSALVKNDKVSSLGYVILRKDKSFTEQVVDANTIYEVRYEFNLNGEEVELPANCVLKFNGGKIKGNGILNLNKGKVEGDGLSCNIINPFNNTINSSQVEIIDEEQHNADRLEFLAQKGIKVVFNTNATFSRAIQSKHYKIDGFGSHTLRFPSSSGLTFVDNTKSVYSANNEIKNINIISQGNCIDFCDEEGNRPANVYWSKFSNLNLKSENGYCIYAGDNKGGTGDQLVFNCDFEDIKVSAGISGFYGLNGIQNVFKEVKDEYCVVATFEDCAGKFDSFNGTFAFEGKLTPTFLKANANKEQRLQSEFNKCNFEDYSGVLFDCNQPETFCHFSFTNCQIYISKSADTVIDKAPFQFHYLYNLVWNNNRILHVGKYATGVALMSIVYHEQTSYTGDTLIPIIGNGYAINLDSVPYKRKSAVLTPAEYGKKYLPSTDGMVINEVHTLLIHTKIKKVNIVSGGADLWNASAIGLTVTNDVEGEVYLDYFDLVNPYSRIYRSILLCNNNSKATIVIRHKLAYAYRFECEDEANIKLKPKECIEAILDIGANATNGKCIIKSRNKINRLPVVDDIQGVKSLGYKVLLGDRDFASQVTEANTIYEIRDSFDLGGKTVTLKDGCTLKFSGGMLDNGTISNISIAAQENDIIFGGNINASNIKNQYIYAQWFGEMGHNVDSSDTINRALNASRGSNTVLLPPYDIRVDNSIIIGGSKNLKGRSKFNRSSAPYIIAGSPNISVITVLSGFYSGNISNISIKPMDDSVKHTFIGVDVKGCESLSVSNVKVTDAKTAYNLVTESQISLPSFVNIAAHSCYEGMRIEGIGTGWTNGIYIKPSWFTNNYVHFHILKGSVTTIQGGNVEIGNSSNNITNFINIDTSILDELELPYMSGETTTYTLRGILARNEAIVNVWGCIWGENVKYTYFEARDFSVINVYGDSHCTDGSLTSEFGKVNNIGSQHLNLGWDKSDIPTNPKEKLLFHVNANNLYKSSYGLYPIDIVGKETNYYPTGYMRAQRLANGLSVISTWNDGQETENPITIQNSFTFIFKWLTDYTKTRFIHLGNNSSYIAVTQSHVSIRHNGKDKNIFFRVVPECKDVVEEVGVLIFDKDNNRIIAKSQGAYRCVDFDLSDVLAYPQNIKINGGTTQVVDLLMFNGILTANEVEYWERKVIDGVEPVVIGAVRPDTAPIGHHFFDTAANKLCIKTNEDYAETLSSVTWVDSTGTEV